MFCSYDCGLKATTLKNSQEKAKEKDDKKTKREKGDKGQKDLA